MPAVKHPNFIVPGADTTVVVSGSAAVTKSDSEELTYVSRGLYIGTGGTLKVTFEDGSVGEFTGILGGTVYPFAVRKVWATGTGSSGIVALY